MKSKEERRTEVLARTEAYRALSTTQKIELVKSRLTKDGGAGGSAKRELTRLENKLKEEKELSNQPKSK